MDRAILAVLGSALVAIGVLMTQYPTEVFYPQLWEAWFAVSGVLCIVYAVRWERAGWVRPWSGAFAVTATASRAMALLSDQFAGDGSSLPDARLVVAAIAWSLISMLLLWAWVRVLPYAHLPLRCPTPSPRAG